MLDVMFKLNKELVPTLGNKNKTIFLLLKSFFTSIIFIEVINHNKLFKARNQASKLFIRIKYIFTDQNSNSIKDSLFIFFWLNLDINEKYKFGAKKIITELKSFCLINKFENNNM